MKIETPLFSIITVSYNSEKTIRDTIKSVLNQTETNFEYILIDGKSTDKTIEIIKSYENKFKEKGIVYKWISEKDTGIYNAFNKGINLSKGDWISFLGSDDIYLKNALKIYKENIFNLKKEVDFVYSNILKNHKIIASKLWEWNTFKRKMTIAHVGSFHHKNYFKTHGLFNEEYKIAGDYEVLLRAKQHLRTHKIDELTVVMGDDGVSSSQIKKVYIETTRAKIETANLNMFIARIDYNIWMLKYQIKKRLHAFTK
jgi:glycosyltransferase involved in cell wall biosynthesis